MDDSNRRKRPPVERTQPDRSWMNGSSGPAAPGKSSDPREAGYHAINNAYRLIDEYVRQGQRMAENLWMPLGGSGGRTASAFNAPERLMRAMGDMTMAWVEMMEQFTKNAQSKPEQGPAGSAGPFASTRVDQPPGAPSAEPAPAPSTAKTPVQALKLTLDARGRVEISVQLGDGARLDRLETTELRSFGSDAQPISGVELSGVTEDPVLRVRVPEGQPPGTYNGLFLERGSQRPCGTITLVVH
jgi:hypothetical protein